MKKKLSLNLGNGKVKEQEINYIPVRYILAFLITVFEVVAIIGIVIAMCIYLPYFYVIVGITTFFVLLKIVVLDDNPDYKIPWMIIVLKI